jgi:Family of unknown function (DUF6445)
VKNYVIPTTVVDDFFDDPYLVTEFAKKQSYAKDLHNQWPGERSESVHKLNPDFFANTINKFLRIFYPEDAKIDWSGFGFFQRISNVYDQGWVHVDGTLVTGIIYLNEDNNPQSGTTIYQSKVLGDRMLHVDKRTETIKTPELSSEYKSYREENANQFEESIVLKNKFNRLVAFDSHLYHAGNDFTNNDQSNRLTLVFFLDKIHTDSFPLQRIKRL